MINSRKKKYFINQGDRFGRLVVIKEIYVINCQNKYIRKAICRCDCGKEKTIIIQSLIMGATKSCGCLQKEKFAEAKSKCSYKGRPSHNMSFDPIYNVYRGMKMRCYDKNWKFYYRYGGRGITICEKWLNDKSLFFKWAYNNGFRKGLTIERINNSKGYSPKNCTFVTQERQANNTRSNHIINDCNENMSLADFCRKHNYNYPKLQSRLTTQKFSLAKAIINCDGFKGTRVIPQKYSLKLKQCENV